MRILLVTDYFPPVLGGISSLVESLAEALKARHHEICVYAVSGPMASVSYHGLKVEKVQHFSSFFPFLFKNLTEKNIPPAPDPVLLQGINRIVSHFKPDVIHAHGWVMLSTAAYRTFNSDVRSVATLHDYGFACAKRNLVPESNRDRGCMVCSRTGPASQCLRCCSTIYGPLKSFGVVSCLKIFGRLVNNLDCVSAVSNYVAERARLRFTSNILTIPNFVNHKTIMAYKQNTKLAGFSADILFVGRLCRQKGIYLLLEAFKILRKVIPEAKLAIVGKEDPYCRFQIDDRSILHRKSLGKDELSSLYMNSKIVVVPSIWAEPQPMVALEAMAFGKPLVVTAVGGLKEMVVDRKTGFVVKPSPKGLADALICLLSNPSTREEMGYEGRNHLLANYAPEVVVPRIEKMYELPANY